jgi:ectoine hydroxylase
MTSTVTADEDTTVGEPLTGARRAEFEPNGYLVLPNVLDRTGVAHAHPPVLVRDAQPRFAWHQDGGRQNRELETDPRPRLSVKAGYWLSDISQPGRGNLKVVPGSHTVNRIAGPPRRDILWPDPPGTVEVTAQPGVVLFDRRIWHARSENRSAITRKVVFGYTYRWIRCRDLSPEPAAGLTAIQRQLLGPLDELDSDHTWGHDPATVPLHEALRRAGHTDVR